MQINRNNSILRARLAQLLTEGRYVLLVSNELLAIQKDLIHGSDEKFRIARLLESRTSLQYH